MKFYPFIGKKSAYCLCWEFELWVWAESERSCSVSAGSSGWISVDVFAAELFWSLSSILTTFCCGRSSRVVFEYGFLVREVHPFMSEPSGTCYSSCEGVWAVGGPWLTGWGKTARSQNSVTLYSHCCRSTRSQHHSPFVGKSDKSRKCSRCSLLALVLMSASPPGWGWKLVISANRQVKGAPAWSMHRSRELWYTRSKQGKGTICITLQK